MSPDVSRQASRSTIPLWGIVALLAAYPIHAMAREDRKRRERKFHGRCSRRDYDLTGNTSGTFPECCNTIERRGCARATR